MNYRHAISDFEKYLEEIYSNNDSYGMEYKGYLINLKDYEKIKESIDYNKVDINDSEINFSINQIEFKTPQYLINMILNENKYIFIKAELWKLICDKNKKYDSPIIYKVNRYDIIFNLDNKEFSFNHNKNIIDKDTLNNYNEYKSYYEKITNIFDSIIKYYNFENKILNDLKKIKKSNNVTYQYLLSKIWIDKWKKCSNYEYIKDKYLQKDLYNKEDVMNDLIYYLEENKINCNELPNSKYIKKFSKKEELESYLKNDSLVLINSDFLFCFYKDFYKKLIEYNAFNNKIHIFLDSYEILSFKSNNNIISLNGIINYSIHLKQLIKIFYFQKEIKSNVEERYNIKNINLVSKKVINIYKNIFNYKKLYNFLERNLNIKRIKYDYLKDDYYKIINELLNDDDYIDQFIKIEENKYLKDFKDINENFIELEYKTKSSSEKNLKYIINFEIINKDIKDFFIENNIAKEEHFISLNNYISKNGEILIIFEKNNNNFYEIGHFNDNEDFIIEYIIDEFEILNKNYIIDYFFKYGINYFPEYDSNEPQNIINLDYQTNKKCYYYKIEEKIKAIEEKSYQTPNNDSINNIDNNGDIIDNKYVKDIFSILLSIFIFERFLLNNSISQNNNINKNDVFLLSNQFLIDFKNLFSYDKIYSVLEKLNISSNSSNYDIEEDFKMFSEDEESENILKLILNNEIEFEQYKDKDKKYFIFEKKSFIEQNFLYPDNFCVLDKIIYSKINKLLNINIGTTEEFKYELSFNHGKLIFKPKTYRRNNYLILIYSLINNESSKDINYIPEILLSFENFGRFYNSFKEIKNENIFKACLNNKIDFENKYNCKSYLINKNNIEEQKQSENIELNINNNKVIKYLSYLITIYNEYSKIKKELNEKIIKHSNIPEEEYYLINRKYMNEFENILHFKEFINEINVNEIQNLDLDINNINNDILNKVRGNLKEEAISYLITLEDNKLINNDNNYDIYKDEILDNENNKIYYYNDCQIITQKIYILLRQIENNISTKTKIIKCILNNSKVIIYFNDNIINSGYLNDDNTFIIEHIIYSGSSYDISKLFEIFKDRGFTFIQQYLSIKRISIYDNYLSIEAKIYSLLEENDTKKNLSPKLKSLILLSLFKNKKINYQKDKNKEKVFLINKEWLFHCQFDEINKLIEKNYNLKSYLNKEDITNLSIDSIQMNDIISFLDYDSLLTIDDNISKLQNMDNIPCQAKAELLKLDNKEITIYTNFVMINEEISKIFENNFEFVNVEYNTYLSHMDGDIIIISKYPQYSILFGKINMDYSFDIKYIFDFDSNYKLENELKSLMDNEIKEYIKNKTLFKENDLNIISPIFENDDDILGYCYKYYSNRQYTNNNNFYFKNENLLKAIEFYFYCQEFSKNIKESKGDENEYFLINNNLMSEIKINYEYKQIKEILDTINFMDSNNKKMMAIKHLSNDIINYFKDNNEIKNKFEKDYMEPDIIPISDFNTGKSYMIYDKFELLEKEKARDLINGIYLYRAYGQFRRYSNENSFLKCIINEGKIIIEYPQNFNGNDKDKYIFVIGELNDENNFLNEYIIIYNDYSSKCNHINSIKGNLNNFLSTLQLYKNSMPIIDRNNNEIGTIIKFCSETCTYNPINSNTQIINKKEINNNINNNTIKETFNNEPQYPSKKDENYDYLYEKVLDKESNNNEDEYNLDYQTNTPDIRAIFVVPPEIGLQNIGATCYMNSTLQCFCHIEKFVNYFKYSKHVISMVRSNKNNLTSSFKLLIEKLWPNNYNESYSQKIYAPEEFKNKISKMNPLFEGIAANDAKDLVNFIIMTLHEELNKAKKSNIKNNNIFLDQRNQQIMFNNFKQNFASENKSIISDLFYGINCNITKCGFCNVNIYNYQIYFFLVFPLEEVRKFKNNNSLNNSINIYDCFDYDRKVNLMYGENSMFCNYCKQNANCQMCTCLTTGPEILILLLNRGKGIEFNVKINFMEDLDLSNYIQYKNTGSKYKLIGVITHIGESGMGGHFIAYCKDPISQSWNKYNDAIVSEVQDKDFQREVINFAMPYLLFYQKSS